MEPSSLIFLVIIGIWGAYFVQYWVRRREHLATIRSVDAFSETMRVLQVRAPLPSVDDGGRVPRTYAVSPARAMRPQVTVKRAEAYAASPATAAPPVAAGAPPVAAGAAPAAGRLDERGDVAAPSMSPSRATRGIVLLVGLLGTLVFGLLAVVGVLVWWAFVVPLLMAVGGFVWLRAGVQAEVRARRAARGRARRAASGLAPSTPAARAAAAPAHAAPSTRSRHDAVETEIAEHEEAVDVAPAPYDVSAASATEVIEAVVDAPAPEPVTEHEVALPELDEDDIPLTWDPRPVPRPTYTMKARAAQRPAPTPEVEPAAGPVRAAYEDQALQRRTAGA
ncbi:hypothetical protein [Knoellia aerolata]|uniref:Uncharacterized protein n=1 Tax=Knoellia aerolata DSM 18566 TaxID=1385519 RepID=A0A0A0K2T9_9MICO|nr:hypothetical protein [Knoellia aerolata]KGN42066.1 hypothetical protein N801_03105 [Knoellia aerolata DSM 18566]